MQIMYDISVLGTSFRANDWSGIPRAVLEILYALAVQKSDCRIEVCSTYSVYDSWDWLQTQPALRDLYFKCSLYDRAEYAVNSRLETAYAARLAEKEKGHTAFGLRLEVAVLDRVKKYLFSDSPIARWDEKRVAQASIYHSPSAAISPELRRYKHLGFVQTVYDLYPVLYPELCTPLQKRFVGTVLSAIEPTDWIIADSESAKADLCAVTNIDSARVTVTYLAADKSKFYPCSDATVIQAARGRYGLPPDAPYLLSVCTLEPRKNLETIIRSFVSLMRQQANLDLYLVLAGGKGWGNDKILATIAEAGDLKNRIIVTGFISDEDLAPLYSGALCFVFPSLYEGFGLPPLEAMQCGTPVITSNTSSLPEVVGEAGVMVNPSDTDGLCQAIWKMNQQPGWRSDYSRRGLARAQKFSWERCAQQTIAAYQQASNNHA